MTPIHELLNRIHWDPEFGRGTFELGYYDRIEHQIIRVPLQELTFADDHRWGFELVDDEGQVHRVPLHRVRELYKDGRLIWHRPDPSQ